MSDRVFTKAVILSRIDYGESDRILTLITPNVGKLHLLAKSVRKEKSKLAGGIELFSEIEVGFVKGRGDMGTLVSSRLIKFYDNILKDITKVQLMYQILRDFDKTTEDNVEEEYFNLLVRLLKLADSSLVESEALELYYKAQLLDLSGHTPNLITDSKGIKLSEGQSYNYDLSSMSMISANNGRYKSDHLKYLRLLFSSNGDKVLFKLKNGRDIAKELAPLIDAMMKATLYI